MSRRSVIRTVAAPARHEIDKIKGSRFIASVAPAATAVVAQAFVEARRKEFRNATHCCFAWRLADSDDSFRSGDDGEPSGTAGRPILDQIDGRGLSNVVLTVTRYYGGTKLGSGGLARAYGGAAGAVLDRAEIVEQAVTVELRLRFDYAFTGAVDAVLGARRLSPAEARFGAAVELRLAVPVEDVDAVRAELRDATQGRAVLEAAG